MTKSETCQPHSSTEGDAGHDLARLCDDQGTISRVRADRHLSEAIEAFRSQARLRMLPVVDAEGRPIGAIFEPDVRAILYNPYGHALLTNPSFNSATGDYARPCPTVDCGTPLPALLDTYAREDGTEGVILTHKGRLAGVIANRTLIRLVAEREAEVARARAERLAAVQAAGDRFIADISQVAERLSHVAGGIGDTAATTAARARDYSERAAAVAAAAEQTSSGMLDLAEQGSGLAAMVDRVRADTAVARQAATRAVVLSGASLARGHALDDAAGAIGATLARVQAISRQAKLLAINAAIEAARMGAEGSGFAVVARELKQFATKTDEAAGEINERIGDMRQASGEVIEGQCAIEEVVHTIQAMTGSIDEAVSTQSGTAHLLAGNVDQAVEACTDINGNVMEISRMGAHAAERAGEMRTMASELSSATGELRARVGLFVADLNGAGQV